MIKKRIVYIVGTRPEFIRSTNIISTLRQDPKVDFKLVHTGQHYDYLMNEVFFKELGISKPNINLEIGSHTHPEQIAQIMIELEKYFLQFKPHIVAVFGDTNSTLASALTSVKLQIPVAHIEAGAREWEMDLPEEINRRIVDHISNLLLPVSDSHANNLKKEKVRGEIFNVGDPQYEVFKKFYKSSQKLESLKKYSLQKDEFALLTMHRDKNVDESSQLIKLLTILDKIVESKIVFPAHPRTKKLLKDEVGENRFKKILLIDPLGYGDMNHFLANCSVVITDSGGLQKEAYWAKKPCITLREHTAWSETVDLKLNYLAQINYEEMKKIYLYIKNNKLKLKKRFDTSPNPYYKPNTARQVVTLLKKFSVKSW